MAEPYKTTSVWTSDRLPAGIRSAHSTKAGTWGLLNVLEGEVLLVFEDGSGNVRVTPGNPGLIPPEVLHHVEPAAGAKMQVEFYHENPLA
ncbi:DUF1971 domain-containing protein [Novosphingobium sp. TH158]|uniref:DUF1971 domain-containing protein n=1 Tax=Novosphingobium sp. TH158 TaxID=2067455 RepID=UPI000C79665F|nr:DUF1971 domain-containing protein [Novosphingobium sp. TH158]PLK27577.1 hypothetical protein C0V78_12275 [Novosphingobium sp. TH158]